MFYLAGFKTVLRQSQACTNLIGAMNDDVSSVDVEGGCVVLCEHSMCRGRCQEIHYYTSDLSRLGISNLSALLKLNKKKMQNKVILVLLLVMVGGRCSRADPLPEVHVVFYSDKDFKGLRSTYILSDQCANLNGQQNDHFSSVNVEGHCIEVCEHVYCRGPCVKVRHPVADFNNLGINDLVSSVKTCSRETRK
ncbi:hypothetical protein Fcan01_02780 [Folsomia candida]|uniref:Beta/gamma crystallin 'Greek key' domain-containing protein n=1 Tax=Folsomia candida TaxID=158441 RepID=A0A226F0P0_FOLCA|nr:hypothetical protein Fcan01_02780 [Folsomia candida]